MSLENKHVYVYKRGNIIDTEIVNAIVQRQTTFFLRDSTIDSRIMFADATSRDYMLQYENIFTEEQILDIFYKKIQCKIGTDTVKKDYYYNKSGSQWFKVDNGAILMYNNNADGTISAVATDTSYLKTRDQIMTGYNATATLFGNVYYSYDSASDLTCVYNTNILTVTKKYNEQMETKYIDFVRKQIYTEKRILDVPDNYQIVAAIADIYKNTKSECKLKRFTKSLVNCDYYCKHYLPENISVGETNCSEVASFIFAISSLMISFQRIDADENLNQKHIDELRLAYNKYNSGLFRDMRTIARNVITAPTMPFIIPYYLIIVYALNKWGS
jgi:hypothetical protein